MVEIRCSSLVNHDDHRTNATDKKKRAKQRSSIPPAIFFFFFGSPTYGHFLALFAKKSATIAETVFPPQLSSLASILVEGHGFVALSTECARKKVNPSKPRGDCA